MFCLAQDTDGHWYVIPADLEDRFKHWLDSADAECGITPEWAIKVNGSPALVRFPAYSILR
jgi:hypothetical protein